MHEHEAAQPEQSWHRPLRATPHKGASQQGWCANNQTRLSLGYGGHHKNDNTLDNHRSRHILSARVAVFIFGIPGTRVCTLCTLLLYKRAELRDGRGLIHAPRQKPQGPQWGHAHLRAYVIDDRFQRDAVVGRS